MIDLVTYRAKLNDLRVCVIIPTFNNSKTLAQVISDVLEVTDRIIIVNDGSTDNTTEILKLFSLHVITLSENSGKGNALQTGFKKALDLGYEYAITIDSDGQHFAKDIPSFIDKLESNRNAIIIGARNMDQDTVPGKSSFGYWISNYWFKVETGINAPDTQSGFRLYPIALLKDIKFYTNKFEFEIEVLVRSAWRGIEIESVPITVYYAAGKERISHFRPVKDFTRIGLLHFIFVVISLAYIKPKNYLRKIFNREKIHTFIREQLFNKNESDLVKSFSIAFGIFMGILPVWGFQLIIAIFIALLLRLNKTLVIIAANISIPPMIPLIIYLSYKMGGNFMQSSSPQIEFNNLITLDTVRFHWQQYLYGSIMLAILSGLGIGLLSWILLKVFKRRITVSN